MSMNITETIKFMIDNTDGVDIDELIQHLWNIKYNERLIINDDEEEIPVEEKEEIPVIKERILCNECNIYIVKSTKSRHYKTKKHIKNTEKNNEKQAEETKLMELEDTNINEIPPPIPDEVPEYKKSKHYINEEIEEVKEDGYDIKYRRVYYNQNITDKELVKLHPIILKNHKNTTVKYRENYTVVIYRRMKGLIGAYSELPPPIPPVEEQKFNYSEEEMTDINEKWHCKLCNTTIHRIQRNQHFKDLWHIYKRERKNNRNAVRPPYDYESDVIPEIEGLNYCYQCRLYYQENQQVHLDSEEHIMIVNMNRNF